MKFVDKNGTININDSAFDIEPSFGVATLTYCAAESVLSPCRSISGSTADMVAEAWILKLGNQMILLIFPPGSMQLSLNAESASLKSQVNQLAESSEKTEDGKCCIEEIIFGFRYQKPFILILTKIKMDAARSYSSFSILLFIAAIIAANYYHSGEAAMSKGSFEDNFSIMWYEDHFTTSSDGQIWTGLDFKSIMNKAENIRNTVCK
ncbi:common plant regulatory factor [Trifolium repens]|nr:common plant regulatory factor [Trifolium repens]